MPNLLFRLTAVALLSISLSACAPDAFDNFQAKGFDAYLNTLKTQCRPLQIGSTDLAAAMDETENRQNGDQYDYWLDQTSRLYYKRISPTDYRNSVEGMLGQGSYNKQSFDCILLNLPAQRPDAPKGMLSM